MHYISESIWSRSLSITEKLREAKEIWSVGDRRSYILNNLWLASSCRGSVPATGKSWNCLRTQCFRHSCFLYCIKEIRWIKWIQLEPVKHDWRQLKVFLPLIHSCLCGVMVMTPDSWSVVWRFKSHGSPFDFEYFCYQISSIRWIIWYKIGKTLLLFQALTKHCHFVSFFSCVIVKQSFLFVILSEIIRDKWYYICSCVFKSSKQSNNHRMLNC